MIHPKDTAIHRKGPSAPLRYLLQTGNIPPVLETGMVGNPRRKPTILDFGCGHGADVRYLRAQAYPADGYDLFHPYPEPMCIEPGTWPTRYDIVLCTYVLNVIVDDEARAIALDTVRAVTKPGGVAFVTVRRDLDADTETQRRVVLDFPSVVVGTGFEIYRVDKATN